MTDVRAVNAATITLVKSWESFVPFVYDDLKPNRSFKWSDGKRYGYSPWEGTKPRGTLTIGYGHTDAAAHPLKCHVGTVVTEPKACEILAEDLRECREHVQKYITVPLNDNQFGALVSFEFNTGGLLGSSLRKKLNSGDYASVPYELGKWIRSKGQVLQGLVNRRNAEITLWNEAA